jgi:hypothetical protein
VYVCPLPTFTLPDSCAKEFTQKINNSAANELILIKKFIEPPPVKYFLIAFIAESVS